MLSLLILICFTQVDARCQSGSCLAISQENGKKRDSPLVVFDSYSTVACEKACCQNALCIAYARPIDDYTGNALATCELYAASSSEVTDSSFVLVNIERQCVVQESCQISNITYGKKLTPHSTSTATQATCQSDCCADSLCVGFGRNLNDGTGSGECRIYYSYTPADVTDDADYVLYDTTGCAPDPAYPLLCARGDPTVTVGGFTEVANFHISAHPTFMSAPNLIDRDIATYEPVDPEGDPRDTLRYSLDIPRSIYGITVQVDCSDPCNLACQHIMRTAEDCVTTEGEEFSEEGFELYVCPTQCTTTDCFLACPRCAHFTELRLDGYYHADCQGMLGQYVFMYLRGPAQRIFHVSEIVIEPEPYVPGTAAYPLGDGEICCINNDSPIGVPASHWSTAPPSSDLNVAKDPVDSNDYMPWLQVSLSTTASIPVGRVELDFDAAYAAFMFRDTARESSAELDTALSQGFRVGLSDTPCGSTATTCTYTAICGVVSHESFGGSSAPCACESCSYPIGSEPYSVDCAGAAGKYVIIQAVSNPTASSAAFSIRSLAVYPPSAIASGVYPVRSQLGDALSGSYTDVSGTTSRVDNVWRQLTLARREPIGIVSITSTCISQVLRQGYNLADVCSFSTCLAPGSVCQSETANQDFFGSDQGAIIGVSDTPCNDASGCGGHVCGRVSKVLANNGATDSVTLDVDCRGAVGRYVYLALPQPRTALMNNLGLGCSGVSPPDNVDYTARSLSSTSFVAHKMVSSVDSRRKSQNSIANITTTTGSAAECEYQCFEAYSITCKSWRFHGPNVCVLYTEFIPFGEAESDGSFTTGQTCNSDEDSLPQPYFAPDFAATWHSDPANYVVPVCDTLAPTTAVPTPEPTFAPTPEPTPFPTPEPTTEPTPEPTPFPTPEPTEFPTPAPTEFPTPEPTPFPTPFPSTHGPTPEITPEPTTAFPTTAFPTASPSTKAPTPFPTTKSPVSFPTASDAPTRSPTAQPTRTPTTSKPTTRQPTTRSPTTRRPTTQKPTKSPTTDQPTKSPTERPTKAPTKQPTARPTKSPTLRPTLRPTKSPTERPTKAPTKEPTVRPTKSPTKEPTVRPTKSPTTQKPTKSPTTRRPTR